ncbi:orotate phosphoribosyltransferase, putative [Plasmodium berghei]|uniref:orotate phosphoribosyltransferase n=2 Tax=Plasmodium berghei TaxID=5821 RepID=A0A509ANU7_PLABA|nr:orotate phosphoribosyltransferase, putative [Plasmodium berghei ANKA]CXI61859.1 orotate phosphoribosyltransferase, putative [Plasmodium berghei]SCM23669.1 orotate phosphoribosyltransferase, putative [Plasmodium berghei]SCN26715.1 orotate phosphoribosyltransferase, putative [Plasmodium berghei]SCO61015.1 orotate phosphoribosyltransferase, putative [Plasmodium berghei]SCO63123.1 orotate phosphoribosyltransferase, putative [Plasmodium berghei]|eukprot:XP_034422331.1 orotate phosphoribosyltransferase, putative [Plasmodium berghei ANKA]
MDENNKETKNIDEELHKKYNELCKRIELGNDNKNCDDIRKMKKLLIDALIKYEAIKFGNFILKSKRKSKYFVSTGFLNNAISANIVSFLISNLILSKNIAFDYLFGASYKGIPIVSLTSHFLLNTNKFHNIFYLYDRKEKKEYGDKTIIVGNIKESSQDCVINSCNPQFEKKKKVIIIDDVFTCGTALTEIFNKMKAYEYLQVVACIVLLNRNEHEINENNEKVYFKDLFEQKYNIPIYSILNYEEDISHFIK